MKKAMAVGAGAVVAAAAAVWIVASSRPPEPPLPVAGAQAELLGRIQRAEAQVGELERRRDDLLRRNAGFKKEVADARRRHGAKWYAAGLVEGLGRSVKLADGQRTQLVDLVDRWHEEDREGPAWWEALDEDAVRRRLLDREAELRTLLTPAQRIRVEEGLLEWATSKWKDAVIWLWDENAALPRIESPAQGKSLEEQERRLGKILVRIGGMPVPQPGTLLLSGAHGLDAATLHRLAARRLRALLPPGAASALDQAADEDIRGAFAGSWEDDLVVLGNP